MSADLFLISGGTELIGIKTIHLALQAGYSVRTAVRSQAKAEAILKTPTVKAINQGSRLTFVIVPDILEDGAYNEAVQAHSTPSILLLALFTVMSRRTTSMLILFRRP